MQNHQLKYHLARLAQNAQSLALALQEQHDGEPRGVTERPALIAKLATTLREDFAAIDPNLPTEGA